VREGSIGPRTRFILVKSAVVQLVFAVPALVAPGVVRDILFPVGYERPDLTIYYYGVFFLANAIGALWAVREGTASAARTYLAIALPVVVLGFVVTLIRALAPPPVGAIIWVYLGAAVLFVVLVAWVWSSELRGALVGRG
jgi:hypothetical protein